MKLSYILIFHWFVNIFLKISPGSGLQQYFLIFKYFGPIIVKTSKKFKKFCKNCKFSLKSNKFSKNGHILPKTCIFVYFCSSFWNLLQHSELIHLVPPPPPPCGYPLISLPRMDIDSPEKFPSGATVSLVWNENYYKLV